MWVLKLVLWLLGATLNYDVADGAQAACFASRLKELIAGWLDPLHWQGQ